MRWAHEQAEMVLPDSGVTLGVVSDTHSAPHPAALELLTATAPDAILHAGDIGDLSVLDPLEALAPLYVVRGNIDTPTPDIPDAITLALRTSGGASLRILLTHIAVQGTRLRGPARALAADADADLVICGHSHMPLVSRDGRVGIFNPGSIGPRRFRLPITMGVLTISPTGMKYRHIDCETGQDWHPVPLF